MKRKKAIFYLMCVIALAAAAAVIGFLVYTLKLRTDFRADAMEINNMFLKKGIVNGRSHSSRWAVPGGRS